MDEKKFYQEKMETQVSFTEWFEQIHHHQTEEMRKEDNDKRDRLRILNQLLQLPYDKPTSFEAEELTQRSPRFERFLKEQGDHLCALRLIPKQLHLPKLRHRGKTVREVMRWFKEQPLDTSQYLAHFVPHAPKTEWSTIFII